MELGNNLSASNKEAVLSNLIKDFIAKNGVQLYNNIYSLNSTFRTAKLYIYIETMVVVANFFGTDF